MKQAPQAPQTLKSLLTNLVRPLVGPRCKTHDKDDFPELKDSERCMVCAIYDELDETEQAITTLIETVIGSPRPESSTIYSSRRLREMNGFDATNELIIQQRKRLKELL